MMRFCSFFFLFWCLAERTRRERSGAVDTRRAPRAAAPRTHLYVWSLSPHPRDVRTATVTPGSPVAFTVVVDCKKNTRSPSPFSSHVVFHPLKDWILLK